MGEQKHVSGMTVGPFLSEDTHDAIHETRKRRAEVAQKAARKRAGETQQQPEQQQQQQPSES